MIHNGLMHFSLLLHPKRNHRNMKNTHFSIKVPKPCHEDWNQMTPAKQGRFCQVCERSLVDFSKMSDRELIRYFTSHKGKLCGRFSKHQLERNLHLPQPLPPSYTRAKAMGLLLSGMLTAGTLEAQENTPTYPLPITEMVDGEVEIIEGPVPVEPESFKISGQVTERGTGEVLIGASVLLKGTTTGTVTDIDGNFSIDIPIDQESPVLVFSYSCFETNEVSVSKFQKKKSVQLKTVNAVCTPIVMGYGVTTMFPEEKSFWSDVKTFFKGLTKSFRKKNIKKAKWKKSKPVYPIDENIVLHPNQKTEIFPEHIAIEKIRVYPNPFDQEVTIAFESETDQTLLLNIYDNSGKLVKSRAASVLAGKNEIMLDLSSSPFNSNKYHLQLLEENGNQHSRSLIKIQP